MNRNKTIQVRLTELENKMVETLSEGFGGISRSDTIRRCVQEKYKKAFPLYLTTKKDSFVKPLVEERELTPEQACERAGGKVETVNGIPMCVIQISKSMQRQVPLSKPELFKK